MQRKHQMWPEKPPSSLDQSSVKAETKWKPVLKSEQFLISWTEVIRLSISALWCYLVKIHQCWKVHTDFRETCSPIQNTSVTGKPHIHQEDAKPHSPAWAPPRRIQLLRWPAYNPDLSPNESIWLTRQKLQQRCCRTAEQLELSIRQQRDKTSLLVLLPSNSKMNFVFSVFIFDYWSNLTLQHLKIIAFSFSLKENLSFVGIGVEQKKIYQFILLGWYSQFNFDFGQTTHCYFCYLNQFWWPASEKKPTLVQIWSLWASRVASEGGALMVQLWDRDICSLVTWKYNSEFQSTKLQTSQQTTVFVQLIQ